MLNVHIFDIIDTAHLTEAQLLPPVDCKWTRQTIYYKYTVNTMVLKWEKYQSETKKKAQMDRERERAKDK